VIGSRGFVDEAFAKSRKRFGPKRKTGARRLKGGSELASGVLWSLRDLRKGGLTGVNGSSPESQALTVWTEDIDN